MLSNEDLSRIIGQVKQYTELYSGMKRAGNRIAALGIPTFDSQHDFEECRPKDVGKDFRNYNEYAAELIKRLVANSVPAEPVVFRYAEFAKWLGDKPVTSQTRADYASFLAGELKSSS